MAKGNLPNDVASGVPNLQQLTLEYSEYNRLYLSLTRTQSGEGTFDASAGSGLTYTTNSYPGDVNVVNKGEEGLMNMFAKYVLVDYNLTGDETQELIGGVNQALNPIIPSSGASTTMTITTPTLTDKIVALQIDTTVTGGAITINRNSDGAKPLEDGEGNAIDELLTGVKYYSVVEEASQYVLVGGTPFKGYKNVQYFTSALASSSLIVSSAKGTILSIGFETNVTATTAIGTLTGITIDSVSLGTIDYDMSVADIDGTGNTVLNTELRFEDNFTIDFTNFAGNTSIHIFYALD